MKSVIKWIKAIISVVFYYTGILALVERISGHNGVIILAYHRINDEWKNYFNLNVPPDAFARHLSWLKSHYTVIPLSELLTSGMRRDDRPAVIITFDDGYKDNYTHAFPLLKQFNMPATIFLTVNPILNREPIWYDDIKQIILRARKRDLDLTAFGRGSFPLTSDTEKKQAIHTIVKQLKHSATFDDIQEFIQGIRLQLESQTQDWDGDAMLTWSEITEMQQHNISFQSHTLNHPILTQIPIEQVTLELLQSKTILESHLGQPVEFIAYPNGEEMDYNDVIIQRLEDLNYHGACTLEPGKNNPLDQFRLQRYGIDNDHVCGILTRHLFAAELAGIFDILFFRWLRPKKRPSVHEHRQTGKKKP
jgi:peptidoglycan/xylan/chitin deacetylase (PgdA/CDA1 family)